MTFYEWFRCFKPLDRPPVVVVSMILGFCFVVCAYKVYKHIKAVKHQKQGRAGERAVGQYLELSRESGCHIYHDILAKGFNVDHVVISNNGILVVETKTYGKPASVKATVTFDGQRILINCQESIGDIITQVKAAASYLKRILRDSTGKEFEPFPVVLFPG